MILFAFVLVDLRVYDFLVFGLVGWFAEYLWLLIFLVLWFGLGWLCGCLFDLG